MPNARSYPIAGNLPHFTPGLRRYAAVAILLGVLSTPHLSEASPIDYSFFGVLGNCETPFVGGCMNDWSGHSVVGNMTFDDSIGTFTAFSFELIGGNFTWFGPRFPDPNPNDLSELEAWGGSSQGLGAQWNVYHCLTFGTFPNCLWDVERNTIGIGFSTRLNAVERSQLSVGSISRTGEVGRLFNPFVSGYAQPIPEPASILLLSTGGVGVIAALRRRKAAAINSRAEHRATNAGGA